MWMYVLPACVPGAYGDQKEAVYDPLDLELTAICGCYTGLLQELQTL